MYGVAVVGAGIAGMATAARLQAHGLSTLVCEAHGQPGGCAGFFRRRGFAFDVGPTTLDLTLTGDRHLRGLSGAIEYDASTLELARIEPGRDAPWLDVVRLGDGAGKRRFLLSDTRQIPLPRDVADVQPIAGRRLPRAYLLRQTRQQNTRRARVAPPAF